jgi:hypothetical protein
MSEVPIQEQLEADLEEVKYRMYGILILLNTLNIHERFQVKPRLKLTGFNLKILNSFIFLTLNINH